jgi:pyrimidine deaminase RibD-like protein
MASAEVHHLPATPSTPHHNHLQHALSLARLCPRSTTAFSVGALLVSPNTSTIVSDGYSRELPGNTHAEECCLRKFYGRVAASKLAAIGSAQLEPKDVDYQDGQIAELFEGYDGEWELDLYTTMVPCSKRMSGLRTCLDRILEASKVTSPDGKRLVKRVFCGCGEDDRFVKEGNWAERVLIEAGIEVWWVGGLEGECRGVAEMWLEKKTDKPSAEKQEGGFEGKKVEASGSGAGEMPF